MDKKVLAILDFDAERTAILEPSAMMPKLDYAPHLVLCFFKEVVEKVAKEKEARLVFLDHSESGEYPFYEMDYKGKRVGFFQPGVGAPLSAGLMEEAIAIGAKHIIACGGCGVLDKNLAVGELIIPEKAFRDEGTSFHYLAPSAEVCMNLNALEAIKETLAEQGLPYQISNTWTTDALFRETPQKAKYFKEQGCLCVEMEAAALMAVAEFRGVEFGQILYGGDAVVAEGWDRRGWNHRKEIRENLFWLAVEACLKL